MDTEEWPSTCKQLIEMFISQVLKKYFSQLGIPEFTDQMFSLHYRSCLVPVREILRREKLAHLKSLAFHFHMMLRIPANKYLISLCNCAQPVGLQGYLYLELSFC